MAGEDLLVSSKKDSLRSQAAVMSSALMELESLSADQVARVMNRLDSMGLERILVTDPSGLLLYDSQKTAVYVDDQGNQVTNSYDVSTAQMNYYYFQLSQFNQDEAEYFGVAAPFWTSKGVQKQGEDGSITGTMGAIKVLCSIDPNDDVPPTTMAFMLNMLPQAFMSYVMNYGEALKAIRDAGLAQVAKLGDSADYVTKLLILHDWISQVAEFDMGSMGDITGGGNNDPIQMTAFGALLGGGIGASGVWLHLPGLCICI